MFKTMFRIDLKSVVIGILISTVVFLSLGSGNPSLTPQEIGRLKQLAAYVQSNGDLNLGRHKIIMQGSSIYDDGSEGGGLIIRGGANKIHLHAQPVIYNDPIIKRTSLTINADLNMGRKKIIMQGSSIYDDGSEGGGLIIRGGANKIHLHAQPVIYQNPIFQRSPLDLNVDLNMGRKKIIMQGSSIYDDGSMGGGLILKGGANQIHFLGKTVPH